MPELLFELLSEEIPARMQARAAEDLQRLVCDGLKSAGIAFQSARSFATPRRLALVVEGLPASRPDVEEERRGPRVGAPDNAVQGFLRGAGLSSLDQCEKRDTGKGEFWFAVIRKRGGPTAELLPEILLAAMRALPWPKSMKWGSGSFAWVRPLQSVIALFDGAVLPGAVELGGGMAPIPFGASTRGHRFHGNAPFEVGGFENYRHLLHEHRVVLDTAERKRLILEGAEALCTAAGVTLKRDDGLLDEVAGLVEWPLPLIGTIDAEFMSVPPEVLIVSMRTHQRYFACLDASGALANRFVVVANTITADRGATVVAGNERVLRARLSDAKFFWDQDLRVPLQDRVPALAGIVFHARLGTQGERVARIAALAADIAVQEKSGFFADAAVGEIEQAARLCKADLVSGMVGEFPELQGVMGRYYAQHQHLPAAVCEAIGDHYAPVGPSDRCPDAPISVAVALADKLDQLAGFWSIGEKPTGSRDPFALRRAALGAIRLIEENRLRLGLAEPLRSALARQHRPQADGGDRERRLEADAAGADAVTGTAAAAPEAATIDDLLGFLIERLKVQMRERGVRHDLIDAALGRGGEDDLVRLLARVAALQSFLASDDGSNLLIAYNRAANIVRAEVKKDKSLAAALEAGVDRNLLQQDEERQLADALTTASAAAGPAVAREDYVAAMAALALLRRPLDAFFDRVTVNVADNAALRLNRLRLLARISATVDTVADFARIAG